MSKFQSQIRKAFDVQSEKFRPLWIRVSLVAVCFGWAVFEFIATGSAFWPVIWVAIGAYLGHQFFIAFNPVPDKKRDAE